ncbi:MAG: hypothetical protein JO323_26875 [Acidobacteriia bacterium]|nr:hypothetical protein [Terriglobia bacterium]
MSNQFTLWAVAAAFLSTGTPGLAHHGQAGYDLHQQVTVNGTVSDFKFLNPHCIVYLDAKDDKGEMQKWQGELTSPNHLLRAGWTAESLKPGDKITLTGWRAKSGSTSLWITKTVVNGEELKTAAGD